jgi:nicotinamide-nucleotide amidase
MNEYEIQRLARSLGELLIDRKLTMASAESCTGGWVSKAVTDIEGSSAWFECALVTYSNRAKMQWLGVPETVLASEGAVSHTVVKHMVLGLLDRCDADVGVSISGIAGPGGGSRDKPVGTVWMAWARPGEIIETMRFSFDGDREQVRMQAVFEALLGIKRLVLG